MGTSVTYLHLSQIWSKKGMPRKVRIDSVGALQHKLMISCADVARTLRISPATVSAATSRGADLLKLEKLHQELMEK